MAEKCGVLCVYDTLNCFDSQNLSFTLEYLITYNVKSNIIAFKCVTSKVERKWPEA